MKGWLARVDAVTYSCRKKVRSLGYIPFGWKSSAVLELAVIQNGCGGDLAGLSLWRAQLLMQLSASVQVSNHKLGPIGLLKSEELSWFDLWL